jgi:hypothetical protein
MGEAIQVGDTVVGALSAGNHPQFRVVAIVGAEAWVRGVRCESGGCVIALTSLRLAAAF